jgi:hypothetical protein
MVKIRNSNPPPAIPATGIADPRRSSTFFDSSLPSQRIFFQPLETLTSHPFPKLSPRFHSADERRMDPWTHRSPAHVPYGWNFSHFVPTDCGTTKKNWKFFG